MRRSGSGRRRALATGAVGVAAAYLVWRAGWTLGAELWLAVPLLAAEVLLIARFVLGVVVTLPDPIASDPAEVTASGQRPEVEMLIPAGLADRDELTRTLTGAAHSGATRIRVLDHRERGRIRHDAERFGAEYEVHEVPAGSGPSALVEAARRTARTEVLAWVDAGDVIVPGFVELSAMLADPARPRLAVVQSAVDLVNGDSLLHLVPDRDERALENRVAGPSLSRSGAAPWLGSGSLFRADALDQIGGLPGRGVPAERAAMRLARAGWSVRWSTPPAVRTVAADTLDAYLYEVGTRSHEDWKMLAGGDSPLAPGRVGLRRRCAQLLASTSVLDGAARITALIVLVVTLLTGTLPVDAPLVLLVPVFGLQLALRTAAAISLGRGTVGIGDISRHGLRTMGVHVLSLVRRPRFPVTAHTGGLAVLGRLRLATAALVAVDLALFARALTFVDPDLLPAFSDGARFVTMGAAVWAIVALVDVLHLLTSRVQRRSAHRSPAELVATVDGAPCRVVDITPRGIGLLLPEPPGATTIAVHLDVPRLDGSTTAIDTEARPRHLSDEPDPGTGRFRAGASFLGLDDRERDALIEFCALTAEQRDRSESAPPTTSPDDLVVGSGRSRRALAGGSLAAVLLAGSFVAVGPVAAAPSAAGTISGTVLDSDGDPVVDACVWTEGGVQTAKATTGTDGTFVLGDVVDGTYVVAASDCADSDGTPDITTYSGSTVWRNDATTATVTDGSAATVGRIELAATGRIEGTVVGPDGSPMSGICATFVANRAGDQVQWWLGTSDADGAYSGAAPASLDGTIQLTDCAEADRVTPTWLPGVGTPEDATSVRVDPGSTLDVGPVTMRTGAVVTGRITDTDGRGQPNVCVSAQIVDEAGWSWQAGGNTGPDGTYRFLVAPGRYSLWIQDCGSGADLISRWYPDSPMTTSQPPVMDVPASGATFDAALPRGGQVSGRVTDADGHGIGDVCIGLRSADDLDAGTLTWDQASEEGLWVSSPVPAGSYVVEYQTCRRGTWEDDGTWVRELRSDVHPESRERWTVEDLSPVRVRAGETTSGIDDDLIRAARISGRVTTAGGTQPAEGVCIGGVGGDHRVTDDDGSYEVSLLPDATVELTYSDCRSGRGLVQQSRTVRGADGDATVDVDLAQGAVSSIDGVVLTGQGRPVSGACAAAYLPNNLIGFGMVDPETGTFRIDGLGDGAYFLAAFGCERDDGLMVDSGDPASLIPPTWYPDVVFDLTSDAPPEPAGQGVVPVSVRSSSPSGPYAFCVGTGCSTPGGTVPTTAPPTTAAPTTAPATTSSAPGTSTPQPGDVGGVAPTTAPATTAPAPTAAPTVAPPAAAPSTGRSGSPATVTGRQRLFGQRTLLTSPIRRSPRPSGAAPATAFSRASAAATATTTTTTVAAVAGMSAESTVPATVVEAAALGDRVTSDQAQGLALRASADFPTVPADPPPGFAWDILGGVVLVAGAAIALILVWQRRHPGFG